MTIWRIRRSTGAQVLAFSLVASAVLWLAGTWASGTTLTRIKIEGGYAWGNNATGELDDGTTTGRITPIASVKLAGVQTMSAGLWHCLAVRADGTVMAWGHNASGELGDGTTTDSVTPVGVIGLGSVRQVSSGDTFSLAVRTDGAVFAWGNNASGELGNGKAPTDSLKPVPARGLGSGSGVVAVSAGGSTSMALKSDGAVLAWGNNASGELGNGKAPTDSSKPIQVSGLGPGSGVVAISAGGSFSLALKSDGTVLAWGNNSSGELGNGKAPTDATKPVQVSGLGPGSGVVAISAGGSFGLALKSDGTVVAWGNNQSGESGNGTAPTDHPKPVAVSGLRSVTMISAGRAHALALTSAGTVFAWGDNTLGQVGDGSGGPADKPVAIKGFGDHQTLGVFAGGDHSHTLYGSVVKHHSPSPSPTHAPRPSTTPSPTPDGGHSGSNDPSSTSSPTGAVSPSPSLGGATAAAWSPTGRGSAPSRPDRSPALFGAVALAPLFAGGALLLRLNTRRRERLGRIKAASTWIRSDDE